MTATNTSIKLVKKISAKNPGLDVEIPVYPTVDQASIMHRIMKRDINAEFENLYGNTMDMTRDDVIVHHRYKHPTTELIYRAFIIAFAEQRKAIERSLKNAKKDSVRAPFIVGTQVQDGSVQFGYRPYIHRNVDSAIKEAIKLHDRFGKNYTVFGTVGYSTPAAWQEKTPVQETVQGVIGGRPVSAPTKILEQLASIIKRSTFVCDQDTPAGVRLFPDGGHGVIMMLDGPTKNFGSYLECIKYIGEWIEGYKAKKRGE